MEPSSQHSKFVPEPYWHEPENQPQAMNAHQFFGSQPIELAGLGSTHHLRFGSPHHHHSSYPVETRSEPVPVEPHHESFGRHVEPRKMFRPREPVMHHRQYTDEYGNALQPHHHHLHHTFLAAEPKHSKHVATEDTEHAAGDEAGGDEHEAGGDEHAGDHATGSDEHAEHAAAGSGEHAEAGSGGDEHGSAAAVAGAAVVAAGKHASSHGEHPAVAGGEHGSHTHAHDKHAHGAHGDHAEHGKHGEHDAHGEGDHGGGHHSVFLIPEKEIDYERITFLMVGLILFTIVIEFLVEKLEHSVKGTVYAEMVEKVFKELMILGFISFSLLIIQEIPSVQPVLHAWHLLFEFVHVWIFLVACFFVVHAIIFCLILKGSYANWDVMADRSENNLPPMKTFINADGTESFGSKLKRWALGPSEMMELYQFHLGKRIFLQRAGKEGKLKSEHSDFSKNFDFSSYLQASAGDTVVEMLEVSLLTWSSIMLMLVVNWGRNVLMGHDMGSVPNKHGHAAHIAMGHDQHHSVGHVTDGYMLLQEDPDVVHDHMFYRERQNRHMFSFFLFGWFLLLLQYLLLIWTRRSMDNLFALRDEHNIRLQCEKDELCFAGTMKVSGEIEAHDNITPSEIALNQATPESKNAWPAIITQNAETKDIRVWHAQTGDYLRKFENWEESGLEKADAECLFCDLISTECKCFGDEKVREHALDIAHAEEHGDNEASHGHGDNEANHGHGGHEAGHGDHGDEHHGHGAAHGEITPGIFPFDSTTSYTFPVQMLLLLQCYYLSLYGLLIGRTAFEVYGYDQDGIFYTIFALLPPFLGLFVVAPKQLQSLAFVLACAQSDFHIIHEVVEEQEEVLEKFKKNFKVKVKEVFRFAFAYDKSQPNPVYDNENHPDEVRKELAYGFNPTEHPEAIKEDMYDVAAPGLWKKISEGKEVDVKDVDDTNLAMFAFNAWDESHDGDVDVAEFMKAIVRPTSAFQLYDKKRDARKLLVLKRSIDADNDGAIDFSEFAHVVLDHHDHKEFLDNLKNKEFLENLKNTKK